MKFNENKKFESLYLVSLILKHRRLLLGVTLITILLSIAFSSPFFITPKYKSTVVMFPSSSNSISKALLTEQVNIQQDILQYGGDEQIDQMLQVLNSSRI
ncbi:MAG: Wzz/FepE/Etk N-terminal domain-containing protein, partial [Bacteroidales bacterium]|nr:Wzz/FepE/Etk N-terminal domain-containing protein [Bacteroidales bacterium]